MTELEKFRDHIDHIDRKLIDLLKERFEYSTVIGRIKNRQGIPVVQSNRWDSILSSRKDYAIKSGLSPEFTEEFLQLIHRESIRIQEEITGGSETGIR